MKTKTLIPLPLFFTILFIALTPSSYALEDINVGTFPAYGVGVFNPSAVWIYDKNNAQNLLLIAYVYQTSQSSTTAYYKIWDVKNTELFAEGTFTIIQPVLAAVNIFQTKRLSGYYDGFYIVAVSYNTNYFGGINVYFFNATTKTIQNLGSHNMPFSNVYPEFIFSNNVYSGAYDVVALFGRCNLGKYLYIIKINLADSNVQFNYLTSNAVTASTQHGWLALFNYPQNPLSLHIYGYAWSSTQDNVGVKILSTDATLTVISDNTFTREKIFQRKYDMGVISVGFYKVRGYQYSTSGFNAYYTVFWAYSTLTETRLDMFKASFIVGGGGAGTMQGITRQSLYIINSVCPTVDLRDIGITDAYYYSPYGQYFNAQYDPNTGVKIIPITLKIDPPTSDSYIFSGYGYFKLNPSNNQITLWIRGESLQPTYTVDLTPPEPQPEPSEPDFPSYAIPFYLTAIALPLIAILLPAGLLGYTLGQIGAFLGAILGVMVCVVAGFLPIWVIFLVGLALAYLLLKGKIGGGET